MTGRPRILPAAALGIALLASVAGHAAEPPAPAPTAPVVTVVRAERDTIVERIGLTGTLAAREDVLVNAQLDGLAITEILAEEGTRVAAGQVLARLSRETLDAQLAQATAQVARADAALATAQAQLAEAASNRIQADAAFARARDLVGSATVSRETYEARQAAAGVAAAKLAEAQGAIRSAEADRALAAAQAQELGVKLARTEVRTPVAGIVSRRTARLGAVVAMTGEPLFRLIADGAVELEADVPEILLTRLRPGQPAQIRAAGEDATRPGTVRLVAPEVNRGTRLGRVRVQLADSAGLTIGAFARGQVEVARRDGVLVPLSAVLFAPDGPRVQAVVGDAVQTRRVTLGLRADGRAEIASGLAEGESVIAVSGTFVRDGDRVTPVAAPLATASGS